MILCYNILIFNMEYLKSKAYLHLFIASALEAKHIT